jgi:hypothetical protein
MIKSHESMGARGRNPDTRRVSMRSAVLTVAPILLFCVTAAAADLGARYKGTLEPSDEPVGHATLAAPDDVWSLKSFGYLFKDLSVQCGPVDLVIGYAGSSALWAVVLPRKPGKIARAPQGTGEAVRSVWLRFHPSLVGSLFPARTVSGAAPGIALVAARRIAAHKMHGSMQINGLPMVPSKDVVIADCETDKGRRFYIVDRAKGTVSYEPGFFGQPVPPLDSPKVTAKESLEVFDGAWKAFDREYAMFGVKKGVDWDALKKAYRPLAEKAGTRYEVAGVVDALIARLEDLHAWVKVGGEALPGYQRFRPGNGDLRAVRGILKGLEEDGKEIAWTRTEDGIGYVAVLGLNDPGLPDAFDRVLEKLKDAKGLVLDLRFNGGGSEPLALAMAGRFADAPRIYSKHRVRSGPGRGDLGPEAERKVDPRGPWRFEASVAVLIGQRTMSSAESFALMMDGCPGATTYGDRTAGSSGNPKVVELTGDIEVAVPRWLDFDPAGKPIDGVGVEPAAKVPVTFKDLRAGRDPVLVAALEGLRKAER